MKDFKSQFYRSLNLDFETRKILKWYKRISKDMMNENDHKKSEKDKDT